MARVVNNPFSISQNMELKAVDKTIIQLPDLSTAGYRFTFSGKFELLIKVERLPSHLKNNLDIAGDAKTILN